MHIRMTIPQLPFPMKGRSVPLTDWYSSARHPIRALRVHMRQLREQRQLERAWRIRQQEEHWLRVSELSEDRVMRMLKES